MPKTEGLSASDLEARRIARRDIRAVIRSNLPDREKLAVCLNAGKVYSALTGDDSLIPPSLRQIRSALIQELPKAIARAESKQRATGQESLI